MDNVIFGITVDDKALFEKALTHPSFVRENDLPILDCYERMEFLGDAVLKLAISDILYKKYPEYTEGQMTKIRSIVISDNTIAKVGFQLGIDKMLILGKAEEKTGGRKRSSNIACAFEALIGAFYLDGKENEIKNFLQEVLIDFVEDVDKNFSRYNAKEILQEYTQGLTKETPIYNTLGTTGPAHNQTFEVEVCYEGKCIAVASGKTKKEAQQNAAYQACCNLGLITNLDEGE